MIRELIRQILLEVYELSQEDLDRRAELEEEWELMGYGVPDNRTWRALGLQDKEEIEKERKGLQDYQAKLRSTPKGQKLIQDFMTGKGNVTCAHSITYQGMAVGVGVKTPGKTSKTIFTDWLKKYGSSNKDMLSTVAWSEPLGTPPKKKKDNARVIAFESGFFMKGYPVLVSKNDTMSQTLGSLPPGLIKHQKASGIAKRGGKGGYKYGAIDGTKKWQWSGETLLDNWEPIGIFINIGDLFDRYEEVGYFLREDAESTGLPVWVITENGREMTPISEIPKIPPALDPEIFMRNVELYRQGIDPYAPDEEPPEGMPF